MSLLTWILSKLSKHSEPSRKEGQPVYVFTDDDRDRAIQARKAKNETIQLDEKLKQEMLQLKFMQEKEEILTKIAEAQKQRQQLQRITSDTDENDDDNEPPQRSMEDEIFLRLLDKALPSKSPVTAQTPTSTSPSEVTGVSISDEEIKKYVDTIPKYQLKMAKKLNDDELKTQILNIVPKANSETVQKIMIQIRNN